MVKKPLLLSDQLFRLHGLALAILYLLGTANPCLAQQSIAPSTLDYLDPAAIRGAYDTAKSQWEDAPKVVLDAFNAAEDRKFYQRAAGLSTMTASVGLWYPEPGQRARLARLAVSLAIAKALTRDEILDWYVHAIFLGQGCFGVDGAAIAYFGKATDDLTLAEAAYLAALVRSPTSLHPVRDAARAVERRNGVLSQMVRGGFIAKDAGEVAMKERLIVTEPLGNCQIR